MQDRQFRRRATVASMVRPASPHRERGLELLRAGATATQVASELGVPLATAKGWARSLGLHAWGQRGPDQGPREPRGEALPVLDLLLQGESVAEIAAALGRTRQAIHKVRDRWLFNEDT